MDRREWVGALSVGAAGLLAGASAWADDDPHHHHHDKAHECAKACKTCEDACRKAVQSMPRAHAAR